MEETKQQIAAPISPVTSPPVLTSQLNLLNKINPEATQILLTKAKDGFSAREIAVVGENALFVLRTQEGQFQAFSKRVALTEDKKEIFKIKGSYSITNPGYTKCNQYAGLHLITPPTIWYEGKEVHNPHPIYDSNTHELLRVACRKMALGYSPIGNLVATDAVRFYDFTTYFLQDLQKKVDEYPDAAQFGIRQVCPFLPNEEVKTDGETSFVKKDEQIFTFQSIRGIHGVWMNIKHKEIFEVFKQHIQHQKFGEVIVQRVTERNAMKIHPAIAASNITVKDGVGYVTVFGFRSMLTEKQIVDIGNKIEKGERIDNLEIKVERSVAAADFEEIKNEVANEEDDGERGIAIETAASTSSAEPANPQGEQAATPSQNASPAEEKKREPEIDAKELDKLITTEAKKKNIIPEDTAQRMFAKPLFALEDDEKRELLVALQSITGGKR